MIDASVWVAYFLPHDRYHAATVSWLEAQTSAGRALAAPTLLLLELAGAISRRTGDPSVGLQAVRMVLAWPGLDLVPQDDALIEQATRLAADLAVSGADAVYGAAARRLLLPLVTWDDEQRARASRVVAAVSPLQ